LVHGLRTENYRLAHLPPIDGGAVFMVHGLRKAQDCCVWGPAIFCETNPFELQA
jgi:hypothetical protein